MLNPSSPLARLLWAPMRDGVVVWIGIRPARRAPMIALDEATLDPVAGLGSGAARDRSAGARQVTLIGREDIAAVAAFLDAAPIAPERLRRNIVIGGMNLLALKGCRVRIGGAVLEVTGECHPCSRMEAALGAGGYNAMRGRGGLTARILAPGIARIGDAVTRLDADAAPPHVAPAAMEPST